MALRAAVEQQDFEVYNEGWTADCLHCGYQTWDSHRKAKVVKAIREHLRALHPEKFERNPR